jgi:nitrate reductase gamma subunit
MELPVLLTIALVVCLLGILYRVFAWFTQGLAPSSLTATVPTRVLAAVKTIPATLGSSGIFRASRTLLLDLLLLKRTLDKSILRWSAHSLIVIGFILLLLMHALESQITAAIFRDYQSTLNPYLFLRNLFGVMVLAGLGLAVYRRLSLRPRRLQSMASDWAALAFIALIIVSGMLLEGGKIRSYTVYQAMVEEYAAFRVAEEELALEAYWVRENGLVSPNFPSPPTEEMVAQGKVVSEGSCAECHVSNRFAFASFALAGATAPVTAVFGDARAVGFFWYLHVVACLAFLAWLPFSKMFHILAAPLSLLIKGVGEKTRPALRPASSPGR